MFIGYEHYRQPLAPRAVFLRRLGINAGVAGTLIVVSLAVGIIGYHLIEGLGWLPAYVYAAMIVSGMGPLGDPPATAAGQIFAGTYALFCGLVLVATTGLVLARSSTASCTRCTFRRRTAPPPTRALPSRSRARESDVDRHRVGR